MGFALSGYVLEKPRVGAANSPFTASPNNFVSDPTAYSSTFGSSESDPGRTEYLALVLVDGDFPVAEFGWTKNEGGLQRFDYDGAEGKFRPLPGGKRQLLGPLSLDSNTIRLKVASKPVFSSNTSPFRLSVGATGSGVSFTASLVETDADFTLITVSGLAQLSLETGNLNWKESDLISNLGQDVYFQQQAFFTLKESKGFLGTLGTDPIILNPIPGQGPSPGTYQVPLLRFGFGLYLTSIRVVNEASFSTNPPKGTFEWAQSTGRLHFNSSDLTENDGKPVYYDGVLFETARKLTKQDLSLVGGPLPVDPLPVSGGDLVFRAINLDLCPTGTAPLLSTSLLEDTTVDFLAGGVQTGDLILITGGPYIGTRRQVVRVAQHQLTVAPPFPVTMIVPYRVETQAQIHQFPVTSRVTSFSSPGSFGTVQVNDSSGAVQFSVPDQVKYGTWRVEAISGDLLLECGLSMRFFRSPVDLSGTDLAIKDFTSFYPTSEARLADPIIGAPLVFLPTLPIDDPAYPTVYEVQQGTGTFLGVLPRLDVASPPSGYGYTIDFDGKQVNYALRRNLEVSQIPSLTGSWALQPLVNPASALFELDQGMGYLPLHLVGEPPIVGPSAGDAILEAASGVLTFVDEMGTLLLESAGGSVLSLGILQDTSVDFSSVPNNSLLFIYSGTSTVDIKGVYTVTGITDVTHLTFTPPLPVFATDVSYEIRQDREVLADRFFEEVSVADPNTKLEKIRFLGTCSNSTRLNINRSLASVSRFRFGDDRFSTQLSQVDTDADFTNPSQGVVEVSLATGNLNFSATDVALASQTYWVLTLTGGKDYRISAELGMFQLTERLLSMDELLVTYPALEDNSDPTVPPLVITVERGVFLVRKELTDHPTTTSSILFNKMRRTVATNPAPVVFRGGRPQDETQVVVDVVSSKISFLPDLIPTPGGSSWVTDALPHGDQVGPDERVYIDYNIYEALGGENTITVTKPPFLISPVQIVEGSASFTLRGDRRADFPADYLLRVENEQLYYLGSPTYDAGTDLTSINLAIGQKFRDSFTNPKLYLSSGVTRVTSTFLSPGYFVPELATFESIPRGMSKVKVYGDKTSVYQTGVGVNFSGTLNSVSYSEFYLISGVVYDAKSDRTELTVTQSTARQYSFGQCIMRRSIRPIYETSTTKFQTSAAPTVPLAPIGSPPNKLVDTIIVYRRVDGYPGVVISSPTGFKVDDSGKLEFVGPLARGEEISILYTKFRNIQPGQLRASYTHTIAPNTNNGLVNQTLVSSFTTFIPDSFYFRVETMTNYRGEIAKKYKDDAKASVPSSGPRVSNASQPKLYEQGQKSVFFDEGALTNEDIIARSVLKNYNDTINTLEDILRNIDGRVVGDWDGKFRFDGTLGTKVTDFSLATNQIDDQIQVSSFPITFTPSLTYIGTYLKAYQPGAQSRFYPMLKTGVGKTITGKDEDAGTGAQLVDFETKNIIGSDPTVYRRVPRARVLSPAKAGETTLYVDSTAAVDQPPYRPAFLVGMKVVIQDADGTFYVPQSTPLTVGVVSPTSLSVGALPLDVPAGATVYLGEKDDSYQKSYRVGMDVSLDNEKGYLLYIKPYSPFDGSVPLIPEQLCVQPPNKGELLQGTVSMSNGLTSPKKIPALYGQAFDDSGDQRIPLIGPSLACESNSGNSGYFDTQLRYIAPGGVLGSLPAPFVGVGNLDSLGTTITLTSGMFPSPVPQAGDLVRILDGSNGPSPFHRISTVGVSSLSFEHALAVKPTTGFQFLVTTAPNLWVGSFSVMSGETLTDLTANFQTLGIQPGDTVVLTDPLHPSSMHQRRQVVSVLSETELVVDYPFTGVTFPETYRICHPLNTFSYKDELAELSSSAGGLVQVISTNSNSEIASADAFFNSVFTDKFPGLVAGTFSGDTLTGAGGVDFITHKVQAGDYVYAAYPQGSAGIFLVASVVSSSVLKVSNPPSPGGVTFRVASAFGVVEQSLKTVYEIRKAAYDFVQKPVAWRALVSTQVPVLGLSGSSDIRYFARGFLPTSLTNWYSDVILRQTSLFTSITDLETILASGDRLYDKRYTWIDARINLEKGLLVKQQRAEAERIKAQTDTLNQLIKLLAVQ
jgi:hypothetical protein